MLLRWFNGGMPEMESVHLAQLITSTMYESFLMFEIASHQLAHFRPSFFEVQTNTCV
jgi:hypothetical protein